MPWCEGDSLRTRGRVHSRYQSRALLVQGLCGDAQGHGVTGGKACGGAAAAGHAVQQRPPPLQLLVGMMRSCPALRCDEPAHGRAAAGGRTALQRLGHELRACVSAAFAWHALQPVQIGQLQLQDLIAAFTSP